MSLREVHESARNVAHIFSHRFVHLLLEVLAACDRARFVSTVVEVPPLEVDAQEPFHTSPQRILRCEALHRVLALLPGWEFSRFFEVVCLRALCSPAPELA